VGRRDLVGFTFGAPGLAHAICVVTQRGDDLGLDPGTRPPKKKLWWEVTTLKSWPARTPLRVMVEEIKRLRGAYAVDDAKRFNWILIDRGHKSGIVRVSGMRWRGAISA
jgi:hypothetical protein